MQGSTDQYFFEFLSILKYISIPPTHFSLSPTSLIKNKEILPETTDEGVDTNNDESYVEN